MSVQSIAKPQTQELWVECQGKNRMFFRKNPGLRLCWSMIGHILYEGDNVGGFARRTTTGYEFRPV